MCGRYNPAPWGLFRADEGDSGAKKRIEEARGLFV